MRALLFAILVPNAVLGAQTFHPVTEIARAAETAVAISPDISATATLDPGLRLPRCAEPLSVHVVNTGTVEVSCSAAGWRLYVPVRSQRLQQVYVLRRPLAPGEVIDASAVGVETRDVSRSPGGIVPAGTPLEGRTARRALPAGSVLLAQDAVPPRSIRRGDPVTLISRSGGVEVRASGRALAAAGVDERLSVENVSSRRVVQGVVLASGEVLVR